MNPEDILAYARERADGAVDRVRAGLVAAGITGAISALLSRVRTLWRNNVLATETIGRTYARDEPWLQWQLGRTEKHCRDCLTLNGQIHRASEWRAAGIQPQSPDLECGGWNCDCRLVELPGYTGEGQGSIG